MIRALVFEDDRPFLLPGGRASTLGADARMAGLTLLRRAALVAWKAGATMVTVVAQDRKTCALWRESEIGLPVIVEVVTDAEAPRYFAAEDTVLLLCPRVMPRSELLERLVMLSRAGVDAAARLEGPSARGPMAVSGDAWTAACGRTGGAQTAVAALATSESFRIVDAEPRDCRHLTTPAILAEADRDMYRGLTSISDGYIDRVFSRHISAWFTRRIINTPITPNQITGFHFALGMFSAVLFWKGGYWQGVLGAILLQLSVALDCSDGEVARLKYQYSKIGGWLDVWADNVVHICVFAAIARAAAHGLGVQLALTMGALAVTGVLLCVAVIFGLAKLQEKLRPGQASSLSATNRLSDNSQGTAANGPTLIDRIINEATSRDFTVLIVAFALIGKLEWFAVLAGVGSHVFWMTFALIQLSLLRAANAESR